jgi:hypothetical protein
MLKQMVHIVIHSLGCFNVIWPLLVHISVNTKIWMAPNCCNVSAVAIHCFVLDRSAVRIFALTQAILKEVPCRYLLPRHSNTDILPQIRPRSLPFMSFPSYKCTSVTVLKCSLYISSSHFLLWKGGLWDHIVVCVCLLFFLFLFYIRAMSYQGGLWDHLAVCISPNFCFVLYAVHVTLRRLITSLCSQSFSFRCDSCRIKGK